MHSCTCAHTYTYPPATRVAHSHDQSTETQSSKALNKQFHPNSCATGTSIIQYGTAASWALILFVGLANDVPKRFINPCTFFSDLIFKYILCNYNFSYLQWSGIWIERNWKRTVSLQTYNFEHYTGIHQVTRYIRLNNNTNSPTKSGEFPWNAFTGCLITIINRA